jgi:hypothetical protein
MARQTERPTRQVDRAPAIPRMAGSKLDLVRRHYNDLAGSLRGLEVDLRWGLDGSDRIPAEWAAIAAEAYCPFKEKVTLRIDEDVLRFFRATGQGYMTRINKVLRSYMQARLAGVVKGAEREVPGPNPMEALQVEALAFADLGAQVRAGLAAGQDVADLLLEQERMNIRLKEMERGLPVAMAAMARSMGADAEAAEKVARAMADVQRAMVAVQKAQEGVG